MKKLAAQQLKTEILSVEYVLPPPQNQAPSSHQYAFTQFFADHLPTRSVVVSFRSTLGPSVVSVPLDLIVREGGREGPGRGREALAQDGPLAARRVGESSSTTSLMESLKNRLVFVGGVLQEVHAGKGWEACLIPHAGFSYRGYCMLASRSKLQVAVFDCA